MMNESHEERASLYVLGLLEAAEAADFERELRGNPELAALVLELSGATEVLALSVPQLAPPSSLKEAVMRRIPGTARTRPELPPAWLAWAASLILLLGCAWLMAERTNLRKQVGELQRRDALAQIELRLLASNPEQAPSAEGVVAWDQERQTGVIRFKNLPPAGAGRSYQLWVVDPKYPTPVDAGVFDGGESGGALPFRPRKPITKVDKLAVSVERAGGVEKAEGPIILISN